MNSLERPVPYWKSAPLSLFAWLVAALFTIALHLLGLIFIFPITFPFDCGTRRLMHGVAQFWAKAILATSLIWKLQTEGRENIKPGRPYVIVANHQSMLDILVLLAGLPVHFKFLAKRELFAIPFLGWHLSLAGYIPLERGNRESGRKAILAARQWLQKGAGILFFPEGTRSLDGAIHEFKAGAFKIALEEGIDVLPVVIDGTGDAVPKKSWKLEKNVRFFLSVGKPLRIENADPETFAATCSAIREEMIMRLARIRSKRRELSP